MFQERGGFKKATYKVILTKQEVKTHMQNCRKIRHFAVPTLSCREKKNSARKVVIVPKILCTVDLNNQGLCEPTGKLFKEGLGNIEFQRLKMKGLQFSEFKPNLQRFKHIYVYPHTLVGMHMKDRLLMYS